MTTKIISFISFFLREKNNKWCISELKLPKDGFTGNNFNLADFQVCKKEILLLFNIGNNASKTLYYKSTIDNNENVIQIKVLKKTNEQRNLTEDSKQAPIPIDINTIVEVKKKAGEACYCYEREK